MKKKILITGGAGFIGGNLCEELVKNQLNEVYSLDNYFTGSQENQIKEAKYIRGCSTQIDELILFKPDIIFHLGEYSRVETSFDDVETVFEFNRVGTLRVIEFCRKNNVRLIYAASSTKFGDGGLGYTQSPYAWSKAENVELIKSYGQWFSLNYAICYFYNAYGPREIKTGKYATLIALYAEKMKNGELLPVVLPGTQLRNFTHVKDIVSGLILVGETGSGDGYGIGSPETYSVMEVATMFGGKIEYLAERKGNRMQADLNCLKTLQLGWEPKYKLSDYINEYKSTDLKQI